VDFKYGNGTPSVFNIVKKGQASPILTGNEKKPIVVVGTYENSKLIALPKKEMVRWFNEKDHRFEIFINNIVKFVTNGSCINYLNCYSSIDDSASYKGLKNRVIGIINFWEFNYTDLTDQIRSNNWHFVVSGTFWINESRNGVMQLLSLYGICPTPFREDTTWFIDGNICQNLTVD